MNTADKKYWELPDEKRNKIDHKFAWKSCDEAERYYLWDYCKCYGWRQMGNMSGYKTLDELKKGHSYEYNMEQGTPFVITKGRIIEKHLEAQ